MYQYGCISIVEYLCFRACLRIDYVKRQFSSSDMSGETSPQEASLLFFVVIKYEIF